VSLLDHGPPFFHFGREQNGQLLRCRADGHHADVVEACLDGRIAQRGDRHVQGNWARRGGERQHDDLNLELLDPLLVRDADALLIVDAVHRSSEPGTIHLLEPEVPDLASLRDEVKRDFLADMHWADPSRALILAKALGALPPRVLILGCEPHELDDLSLVLTPAVSSSLPRALEAIEGALARLTG